jgi:hypothetical protein
VNKLRSTVRPVVTFAFALGVLYGFIAGKVSEESFLVIAQGVILFWFATRPNHTGGTPA